jgi:hypothetical protein
LPVALISRLQFDADCVYDRGGRVKVENQRALTQVWTLCNPILSSW